MSALIRYERPVFPFTKFFDDFFEDGFFFNGSREVVKHRWPKVDIVENEKNFIVHADLPGLDKKDIKVSVENGVLSISGEKKEEKKEKEKGKYYYYERSYGSFSRSFALPETVKEKDISANFKDGVLELVLKKSEKVKPKEIEVKVE